MKKTVFSIVPLVMLIIGCAGDAKPVESPTPAGMTLDQAIKVAAERIDARIKPETKIALLNFDSPSNTFSEYVLDELTANLVDSGKLTIVDRKEIDLIRSEFDFQVSGEVSDDSMQDLGRMLGAQSIVSGSLTNIGGSYRIVIRVLNVQSVTVEVQYRTDILSDNRVQALLAGGNNSGGSNARPSTAATSATPSPFGWLGVSNSDLDNEIMTALKLKGKNGVLVRSIFLGSPADKSGIRAGDVITHINRREVADTSQVLAIVGGLRAGDQATFTVIRDGASRDINAYIEARTDQSGSDAKTCWPGVYVYPLTDALREELKLNRNTSGVYVTGFIAESPAALIGIQKGDVIIAVNGELLIIHKQRSIKWHI
jgi:TolB-like protein